MITIKRLYLENYKLFSQKEIDFSGALLSVFDGPNGYGKTSIFDAIELLITGKISRVKECESIDGKTGYQTVFFAQNSEIFCFRSKSKSCKCERKIGKS